MQGLAFALLVETLLVWAINSRKEIHMMLDHGTRYILSSVLGLKRLNILPFKVAAFDKNKDN
ncbi:hypothetical protein SLEP1_g55204 [Rubroshorea leprosula]|uniref:Uncharacterized protein n=1 Tax=Rubroshorea leprosula TaxID=152421 RepID=A0AAV5MF03_9ROSI|nr:hypothetical protein SLEP1_g55204 [Rubroshorea leprosula]